MHTRSFWRLYLLHNRHKVPKSFESVLNYMLSLLPEGNTPGSITFITPANVYLFKANNGSTKKRYEICSKLSIKTSEGRQWRRSGVFIANFEHISYLSLVFLLLTLKYFRCFRYLSCNVNKHCRWHNLATSLKKKNLTRPLVQK